MNRRRQRAATAEEIVLWRQAVADAAPLPGRARLSLAPQRSKPALAAARTTSIPDLTTPARPSDSKPATHKPATHKPVTSKLGNPLARPLDRATHVRLKSGRLPIEGRIDLHGMTAGSAQRSLAAFLRSSQAAGQRAVLVITGRGLDPEGLGRGVLKREAPHWLDALPDIVAGYGEADRRHGGAGALYVRLRRKDKGRQ